MRSVQLCKTIHCSTKYCDIFFYGVFVIAMLTKYRGIPTDPQIVSNTWRNRVGVVGDTTHGIAGLWVSESAQFFLVEDED